MTRCCDRWKSRRGNLNELIQRDREQLLENLEDLLLHVPKPFESASFLGRWHPLVGFWDRLLAKLKN